MFKCKRILYSVLIERRIRLFTGVSTLFFFFFIYLFSCYHADNAVYGTPELGGGMNSRYHEMSVVTSYEVPINTFARQMRPHPVMQTSEQPGTLDRGFVDSFTSEYDNEGLEENEEELSNRNFTPVTSMVCISSVVISWNRGGVERVNDEELLLVLVKGPCVF